MRRFKKLLLHLPPLLLIPLYFILRLSHGYAVYRRLCQRFGENVALYSAFLPSTGEPFWAAAAFRAVTARDGTVDHAKFVVIGAGQAEIARWTGIPAPIVLTVRESNNLLRMYRFLNARESLRFHLLHYQPSQIHIGICENMLSFRQLDFLTMLRETAFGGLRIRELSIPRGDGTAAELPAQWERMGLQAGRTVLLAPHAVSVTPPPMAFWIRLAEELKRRGFAVCTNCASPRERAIPGTAGLALPYRSMPDFLKWAGYLVALRSGLVDLTCMVSCRRVLLYPRENYLMWGVGSPLDCFSLVNMGLSKDAVELEYSAGEVDPILEQALKVVGTWML